MVGVVRGDATSLLIVVLFKISVESASNARDQPVGRTYAPGDSVR